VYIVRVRPILKISGCALAAAVVAAQAHALVPEIAPGQYQGITQRNVFGLRSPEVITPPTAVSAPLPKITLTGITTILGNKRALMKILPVGLKPGETAKELSLILTEGQRESEIEVLQIDEKNGTVKVNNSGTVMMLSFEKDGAKLPAASGPGVPMVPSPLPVAGTQTRPYQHSAGFRRLPDRNPRLPVATPPPVPTAIGTSGSTAGGVPTPTGLVPPAGQAAPGSDPEITAEEQAIIQEIQRQVNANAPQSSAPEPVSAPSIDAAVPANAANLPVIPAPSQLVPQ
jgi:hypothetical protein